MSAFSTSRSPFTSIGWSKTWHADLVDNASSPSPLPFEDGDPPAFEDSQFDGLIEPSLDPLDLATSAFDFPDPSHGPSSTSSNEAEPDLNDPREDPWSIRAIANAARAYSDGWSGSGSGMASPNASQTSEVGRSFKELDHDDNEGDPIDLDLLGTKSHHINLYPTEP